MARLSAGDVVVLDGQEYELLSDPFLGMTGSSAFDSRGLFWRSWARPLHGAERPAGYITWPVGALLDTVRSDS